jgi:hypothetical protein
MPVQTTATSNIYFPDGALVSVKASGDVTYTDLGAINSAVTATLNYDENQVETANAGKLAKQIRNMTVEGAFTLINLNMTGIEKISGGLFTTVDTAAAPVATIPDQTIAAGWDDQISYELVMETSGSDSTRLRTTTAPTLTSVTLDPTGTPEVLVEDSEYVVVADANSSSGWAIQFISSNMATGSPKTFDIVVDYGSNTPVASSTLYAGSSTATLSAYAMKVTHTDANSLVRELELFSVDPNSGGFQFNFKGANEDGVEEMPLTYTAKLDTSLTDGRQLMSWKVDNGAA